MRTFAEAWPETQFVQQLAAQIPWFHNCVILDKCKSIDERRFYISKSIENGWSRNILVLQIEGGLYQRQGQAITNFKETLPEPKSDLAQQTLKDPYCFDFLTLTEKYHEKDFEKALVQNIRDVLLELGIGFAFVGNQVHIEVGNRDFYIDMLFYHLKLRCYVVVELKCIEFEPEFAGKLNFYLSAVDDRLRHPDDGPSIGLLLCKSKNQLIVEYALRDTQKPIGVASWELTRALPNNFKSKLPTVETLESEFNKLQSVIDDS